jgi:hypothetical protein
MSQAKIEAWLADPTRPPAVVLIFASLDEPRLRTTENEAPWLRDALRELARTRTAEEASEGFRALVLRVSSESGAEGR